MTVEHHDNQHPAPAGPLAGLKVLDLSRVLAGPWSSQILGDLGAEVFKIEHPERSDDTRGWGPPFLEGADGQSDAAYYLCCNRNKLSLAIDFSRPEGAALVRGLAAKCDIVLENFRTGGLAKYGLDYASLAAINPRLIYCSITGFGQTGPNATRGGYDFLIQAMSGLMSITGRPDGEPGAGPMKVGLPVSDLFTGLYATISILAALNHRNSTGQGQHIDCALIDTQVSLLANQGMNYLVGGKLPQRLGNDHPNVVPYRDFKAADDYVVVASGSEGQFRAFCRLLGREDVATDARFASNALRNEHRAALRTELAAEVAKWRADDLIAAMEKAGVPGGRINNIAQMLADPQIEARGLLHTLQRDDGTPIKVIGYPAQFSATPASYRAAPPPLGRDTQQVLADMLGLEVDGLAGLIEAGIIAVAGAGQAETDQTT